MSLDIPLEEYMKNSACERQSKMVHKRISVFPHIQDMHEVITWGVFAWRLEQRKERWLKASNAIERGNGPQTPSEIARDYLDWKFPKRLRATKAQVDEIFRGRRPPLYCKPGFMREGVYVDLKAAYFNILLRWGWDVDYFPGRWLVPGRICDDFPMPKHKLARNCLVSLCVPSDVTVWSGEKFYRRSVKNTHVNMGLWSLVQDVLHCIAEVSVLCGGIYCHTDGYIIPLKNLNGLTSYIDSWGLPWGIKGQGETIVTGFGGYQVGEHRTKWLRPHFAGLTDHINRYTPEYKKIIKNAVRRR